MNADTPSSQPATTAASAYRAKGKIACLPKEQRELINHLLLDGHTYAAVCQKMAEHGRSLNPENVSNWHRGPGYQDWLFHQEWREDTRALQESALELVDGPDPAKLNQAVLHLATLQIFAALRQLAHGSLDDKLGGDSSSFSRLVNALSRATRETLNAQKYLEACAQARAALQPMKDPKRKLTEQERRAIVRQVDEILGLDLAETVAPSSPAEQSPAIGIITLLPRNGPANPSETAASPALGCPEVHGSVPRAPSSQPHVDQ